MLVSLDLSQKLISLAHEKASLDYGRPIIAAVCDESGFLVALGRQEGAPLRSIQISQSKAYTAVRMGVTTDALLARIQKDNIDLRYFCDPLMTALPGGSLLKKADGSVIGGIGVSGLASHEDHAITEYLAGLVAAGKVS